MANEKRMIDANKAKFFIADVLDIFKIPVGDRMANKLIDTIDVLPTIDAVEVIRCKDCKHGIWDEENEMWKCVESAEYDQSIGEWIGFYEYHNSDFYCAYGERNN